MSRLANERSRPGIQSQSVLQLRSNCDFSPINSMQVPIVFISSVGMAGCYVLETTGLK
jgi:hypothetical protein